MHEKNLMSTSKKSITSDPLDYPRSNQRKEQTIALFLIFQKIFLKSDEKTLHSESDFYPFF